MFATIQSVQEQSSQYGVDKKSRVQLDDGESKTVYTKPAAKGVYEKLTPGLRVELMAKNSGTGYLIKSIVGEAQAQPPARNGQAPARPAPDKKAQAEYIETKAGQLYYAYTCLQEKFGDTLISEETLRAFASTIIISLDREGPR